MYGILENIHPSRSNHLLLKLFIITIINMCICAHVCVACVGTHAMTQTWGQKIPLWQHFSPSTFIWSLGIELKSAGWHGKRFTY